MLATLYFAYSRAIQSELLRWIDGIKAAMRARKVGRVTPFAPEDDEMPTELRELSAAFNEMSRESAVRERSLAASLAENEVLVRELHHRVKTSLQIIQSYLALTRRLDRMTADESRVDALEARVQVLSIAYGKAFSVGRMRDLRWSKASWRGSRPKTRIWWSCGSAISMTYGSNCGFPPTASWRLTGRTQS
jgi:signal transduction histidine kinase